MSAIKPILEMVKNSQDYEGDKYIYKRKQGSRVYEVNSKYALDEEGNLKEGYSREDTVGFAYQDGFI